MNAGATNKREKVLVTGATGFIGKHVVTTLLENGYKVVAHQHKTDLPPEIKKRCERVVSGDLCDRTTLENILQDVQVVYHLAAYIPSQFIGLQEANQCYMVNAKATMMFAQCASEKGIRRFIHFSTANMYSKSDHSCLESDSIYPYEYATDYMVSKLAGEIFLMNIGHHSSTEFLILRIATPYGPGETPSKIIPVFLSRCEQGEALQLVNAGAATYNFIYVTDISDLAVKVIEGGKAGIYNISSGEQTALLDLANATINMYDNCKSPPVIAPADEKAFIGFGPISIEKAKNIFGFSPRNLVDGLKDYKTHLEINKDAS